MSEWRTTSLGDCADWVSGGTPFKGNPSFWSGTIPWVSAKDMKSFRLHDAEDHISAGAVGSGGKLVPAGTVLLLVRGMTLHNDVPICMTMCEMAFNQDIKAIRAKPGLDHRFLAYWLLAHKPELLSAVDHAGHGTGRLLTDLLKKMRVELPPFSEQRAIASVLGALDDRIELNRRMNETLEAMAQSLFKSWFVDPTRDSLPNGWRERTLGEITGFLGGYAFRSKDWIEQGIPVVKIGSVKPGIVDLTEVSFVSDEVAKEARRFRLKAGDLLIGMTGYVGEVGLVPPTDNPPLLNQRVGKFLLEEPGTSALGFLYCLTRRPEFKADVEVRSHGTAQANVSADGILSVPVIVPPKALMDEFNAFCEPALNRILASHAESRTLAALRDALLPKLLSGELRVPANLSAAKPDSNA